LDAKKTALIKKCIADLAKIDSPDYGLSPTLNGEAFLPLPGQRWSHAGLLTNHRLKSSAALRALVRMGPDSLPFLLGALGDRTPTKLRLDHEGGFGAMYLANELRGNPVNPLEARVLGLPRKRGERRREGAIQTYTVKVGDVCLVAIGQIVGRRYQAVRYQPTACIVVNSPTRDAELRKQVLAIWSSRDSARRLFDSLLLDYATEGKWKEGESFNPWDVGSNLQVAAAMRLLYYFPKETAALIARRLERLRVERIGPEKGPRDTDKEMEAWMRREVANGARTEELVRAVSWCAEPAVRKAVRSIFERTGDLDILLAALPGIDRSDAKLFQARIETFLERVPADEGGAYGYGYNLLVAAGERLGAAAKPLLLRCLDKAGPMRCCTVCEVLKVTNKDWAVELLGPLLADKRAVGGYRHRAARRDEENTVLIRVCDAAAETLNARHPDLKFEMIGTTRELDEQIKVIQGQLKRRQR
jgi:hypothetical protein